MAYLHLMEYHQPHSIPVFLDLQAITAQNARWSCKCSVPAKTVQGVKVSDPDHEDCMTDMSYSECFNNYSSQYTLFAGLAGAGGGLILLSMLGLRYSG